jgi:O-methyltransferase involved in polyketide biosynthesis
MKIEKVKQIFGSLPNHVTYIPVDLGTSQLEVGKNIHNHLKQLGEPLKFGIEEGMAEKFLQERGFSQVCNVNSEDYKEMYFQGVNKYRSVCSLILFAHAIIQ